MKKGSCIFAITTFRKIGPLTCPASLLYGLGHRLKSEGKCKQEK